VEPIRAEAKISLVRPAGSAPPVRSGKEVATTPDEPEFEAAAARWSIRVPDVKSAAVREVLLRLDYQGDVARIYAGGRLITDDFFHGAPWEIGLHEIPAADLAKGLELRILPWRSDAPIYLAADAKKTLPASGQVAKVTSARLLPVYEAVAALAANPTLGGFHPNR
jgi:hypothetical protein